MARRRPPEARAAELGEIPGHLHDVRRFAAWWIAGGRSANLSHDALAGILTNHRARYVLDHPDAKVPRDWPGPDYHSRRSQAARDRLRALTDPARSSVRSV